MLAGTRPEKIRIQKWYTGEWGSQATVMCNGPEQLASFAMWQQSGQYIVKGQVHGGSTGAQGGLQPAKLPPQGHATVRGLTSLLFAPLQCTRTTSPLVTTRFMMYVRIVCDKRCMPGQFISSSMLQAHDGTAVRNDFFPCLIMQGMGLELYYN